MSRLRPVPSMLVVAAALAGCAPMIPQLEPRPLPVPDTYPAAVAPAAAASDTRPRAGDIDWPRFFTDERLQRLIATALANNRDLRIAALNIEQARAAYDVRRADVLPTVGAGATATRQPGPTGSITSTYSVGLVLSAWEIDLFGRLRSLNQAALAQFLATEEARRAVQASLVANVATTYLSLLADDESLAVTRQALATREETMRLMRLRFEHGASSELDVRLAESLLETARVAFAQQTRARALNENALALLLGGPAPGALPEGRTLANPGLLQDLPAGLPSELLVRRPDVRQSEQLLAAANASIGAARAAFFPRISLTASLGRASPELSDLFRGGRSAWTFAPQLLQPLFDAGRNQANLGVATANRDIAVAQYERTVQTAFREVADALAGRATLGEQLRAQEAQAAAEATRVRLVELRYRNGASSALEVLDAQRSSFTAQQALVQTRALQAQNLVQLYRALGGGWAPPP